MLLHIFLKKVVRVGRLSVVYADGSVENYGDGSGQPVAVRLSRVGALLIATNPGLGLGEAYMDGDLVIERGDIGDLLALAGKNLANRPKPPRNILTDAWHALQRQIQQSNNPIIARRNVAHHYDLSYDLYRRFLDEDMQYSCAYFTDPDMTLEEAQVAKKKHIASKLRLEPGLRVLDIGCGWGGLALTLAEDYGVQVTGITLSSEQLAVAERRASERGLSDRVRFSLTDYRDMRGPFDRIVSVGMFEHVGEPNYQAFFKRVGDLLTDDGVALIHSIACIGPPGVTAPFLRKYIFPGGYIPSLSEVMTAMEAAELWTTDLEILRLHYAETLRHWRERFMGERGEAAMLYDERFCRMWECYLAMSEMSFRAGGHMVMHLQLAKSVDALPLTRDYMVDTERALASRAPRRRSSADR